MLKNNVKNTDMVIKVLKVYGKPTGKHWAGKFVNEYRPLYPEGTLRDVIKWSIFKGKHQATQYAFINHAATPEDVVKYNKWVTLKKNGELPEDKGLGVLFWTVLYLSATALLTWWFYHPIG